MFNIYINILFYILKKRYTRPLANFKNNIYSYILIIISNLYDIFSKFIFIIFVKPINNIIYETISDNKK